MALASWLHRLDLDIWDCDSCTAHLYRSRATLSGHGNSGQDSVDLVEIHPCRDTQEVILIAFQVDNHLSSFARSQVEQHNRYNDPRQNVALLHTRTLPAYNLEIEIFDSYLLLAYPLALLMRHCECSSEALRSRDLSRVSLRSVKNACYAY